MQDGEVDSRQCSAQWHQPVLRKAVLSGSLIHLYVFTSCWVYQECTFVYPGHFLDNLVASQHF